MILSIASKEDFLGSNPSELSRRGLTAWFDSASSFGNTCGESSNVCSEHRN